LETNDHLDTHIGSYPRPHSRGSFVPSGILLQKWRTAIRLGSRGHPPIHQLAPCTTAPPRHFRPGADWSTIIRRQRHYRSVTPFKPTHPSAIPDITTLQPPHNLFSSFPSFVGSSGVCGGGTRRRPRGRGRRTRGGRRPPRGPPPGRTRTSCPAAASPPASSLPGGPEPIPPEKNPSLRRHLTL